MQLWQYSYVIAYLGYSAVDNWPWTSLLDIHHPDP